MSEFQDSLKAIVTRKLIERVAREEARHAFDTSWSDVRSRVIFAAFQDAASALKEANFYASPRLENGDTVVLSVVDRWFLTFKSDPSKLRIVCTSLGEEPEEYEVSKLTREQVETEIRKFIESIQI